MPRGGEFSIGGHNFQWDDGVFSVALSRRKPDGFRTAYFHAMASTEEFSVCTCVLRNRTLATRGYHGDDFKVFLEDFFIGKCFGSYCSFSLLVIVVKMDNPQLMLCIYLPELCSLER